MSKVRVSVMPAFGARAEASWMTGPSAVGSENGTPSSRMSVRAANGAQDGEAGFRIGVAGGEIADEGFAVGGGQFLEGGGDAVHGFRDWNGGRME